MKLKECLQKLYNQLEDLTILYLPQKLPEKENEFFLGNEMLAYYTNECVVHRQGAEYESTTEMLYHMEDTVFSTEIPIEQYQFYFEDLSSDACLSFILFYCRHQGVSVKEFPRAWVDYTIRWELGDVKTTGKPFESWGCLHSALAHASFMVEEQMDAEGEMIPIIDEQHVEEGLEACLYLAISLLIENSTPYEVPYVDHIEEYNRANMYLKMEYQKYLLGLKHATITQLELPMVNSNRTLLVDAFIATENTYIGLLKSFLIHDEERTWLKSGFQFFAIHRPELRGTGRDMVIQVDPQLNVHLKDLWYKLEILEEERWRDQHTNVLSLIPDFSQIGQSWNDHQKTYLTLTAPKRNDHQTLGSKLKWSDVVSAIWELYNPAKSITVNPYLENGSIGESCRIFECKPILQGEKHFVASKWNSLGQQQVLVTSPILQRYLAVCASGQYQGKIPPIHPLPLENSFDFIELPFGFAIVHADGVFILDDWNNQQLKLDLYRQEVKNLIERVHMFNHIHHDCINMMAKVQDWLTDNQTLSGGKLLEVNHWISKNKASIRHTILRTMLSSADYSLQVFRETIEKRWAIHTQLNELYETVSELEQIIENHMNLKTNRLVVLITIFGFPVALFSGLFEIIFENLPGPNWFGIHWIGLLLFFCLSFLSIWGLSRYLKAPSLSNRKKYK